MGLGNETYFTIGVIGSKVLLTKRIGFFVFPPNGPMNIRTLHHEKMTKRNLPPYLSTVVMFHPEQNI